MSDNPVVHSTMSTLMLNFDEAVRVGVTGESLAELEHGFDQPEIHFPVSEQPRGLSLKSLVVTKHWDGIWKFLWPRRGQQIYFMSIAFDLSDAKPVVMPPKEVGEGDLYHVKPGEEIRFTLGEGAPIFWPRIIAGGLAVYVLVGEADRGIQGVGEVLQQVHKDVTEDNGSVLEALTKLIKNPGSTIADEVLGAATAAIQPIGSILKANKDEAAGIAKGIFKASGSWAGQLHQEFPGGGGSVTLGEID